MCCRKNRAVKSTTISLRGTENVAGDTAKIQCWEILRAMVQWASLFQAVQGMGPGHSSSLRHGYPCIPVTETTDPEVNPWCLIFSYPLCLHRGHRVCPSAALLSASTNSQSLACLAWASVFGFNRSPCFQSWLPLIPAHSTFLRPCIRLHAVALGRNPRDKDEMLYCSVQGPAL